MSGTSSSAPDAPTASQEVIDKLESGNESVHCTLAAESVWVELPKIVDHLFRKYYHQLRSTAYEMELRVGRTTPSGFVPGVSKDYYMKVRARLQKFAGWFLGFHAQTALPTLGVPTSVIYNTLVLEDRTRVRVPYNNGRPIFAQSEVMQKRKICSITFHLDGQPMGFRLGIAEEKKLTSNAKALIGRAEKILTPTVETLDDKLRYGRDIRVTQPVSVAGPVRLFVSNSAYEVDGIDDPLLRWMKTHGGGQLPPQLANQISWIVMNSENAKRVGSGTPVQVLDEQPEKMIVACSAAGRIVLPSGPFEPNIAVTKKSADISNNSIEEDKEEEEEEEEEAKPPPLNHIFPEGRYVIVAPVGALAAGLRRGTANNHDLECIRHQRRKSFVFAKKPDYKTVWQIDSTETRQAPGVEALGTADPIFELEIEAGPGIAHPGSNFRDQLYHLLLDEATFQRILPRPRPKPAGTAAKASGGASPASTAQHMPRAKRKHDSTL